MGSEQPKEILYWCGIREGELLALPPRTQLEGRRLFPHRHAPSGCPVCAGKTRAVRRDPRQKSNGAAVFDRSNTIFK